MNWVARIKSGTLRSVYIPIFSLITENRKTENGMRTYLYYFPLTENEKIFNALFSFLVLGSNYARYRK